MPWQWWTALLPMRLQQLLSQRALSPMLLQRALSLMQRLHRMTQRRLQVKVQLQKNHCRLQSPRK